MFGTVNTVRALTTATQEFAVNPSAKNYGRLMTAAADHQAEAFAAVEATREVQWQAAINRIGVKADAVYTD